MRWTGAYVDTKVGQMGEEEAERRGSEGESKLGHDNYYCTNRYLNALNCGMK